MQDPISFEVVAQLSSAERCAFARMAMVATTNSEGEDEDAIVLLGEEVLSFSCSLSSFSYNVCKECLPVAMAAQ